jgi:hypothetical protein
LQQVATVRVRTCITRSVQTHRHDERPIAREHVGSLIRKVPLEPEMPPCLEAVLAEMTGTKSAQSWISRQIF